MALGVYFAPSSMTTSQYAEIVQRLKKAGAGSPKGRRYHACFGDPSKLAVFDVWDSQVSFDKFGQALMPILTEMGVDTATPPMVMPVHNVVVPPKKAAPKKAAAKPARAKKAKAAKKGKAAKSGRGKK